MSQRAEPEKQEYVLTYEHAGEYQEALAKAGGDPDGVDPDQYYEYAYAVTLEQAEARGRALAREHQSTVTISRYSDMELVKEEEWPYVSWWRGSDPVEIEMVQPDGRIERIE